MSQQTRPTMKIEDLPAPEKELTPEEAAATTGGALPYLDQSNPQHTSQITDGTSNTLAFADGSVR